MGDGDNAIVGRNRYFAFCLKAGELARESGSYDMLKFRMMGAELGFLNLLFEKVDRMTGRIELKDVYKKALRDDPKVGIDVRIGGRSVKDELLDLKGENANQLEQIYVDAFNYSLTVLEANQARHFVKRARLFANLFGDHTVLAFAQLLVRQAEKENGTAYFMEPDSMCRYVDDIRNGEMNKEKVKEELIAAYKYAKRKPPKGAGEVAMDKMAIFWGRVSRHRGVTVETKAEMKLDEE